MDQEGWLKKHSERKAEKVLMENKIKHLELIQNIISRMSRNSFLLKGWAVTLVSGILALTSRDLGSYYFLALYVPIIAFWVLDTYYLSQERLYRALYEQVRQIDDDGKIDFSLSVTHLGTDEFQKLQEVSKTKLGFLWCFFSVSEIVFYLALAVACTGIFMVIKFI